nr:MAG TPA: U5 small nuclear ribonucleoprotein component [Caudoviricetes sp.]
MKWKQRQLTNLTLTNITLDNGNRLVTRQTDTYKLQSLYDEFGKWIKSKLRYYKSKQVIKEVRSNNIK